MKKPVPLAFYHIKTVGA